jgi:hypothetical protein
MRGVGVLAAEFKAMTHRLEADSVTSGTLINALLHLGCGMSSSVVCHGEPSFS